MTDKYNEIIDYIKSSNDLLSALSEYIREFNINDSLKIIEALQLKNKKLIQILEQNV